MSLSKGGWARERCNEAQAQTPERTRDDNDNVVMSDMKILVVGGGGREHALAWKLAQSPLADRVFVAPGNGGTAAEPGVENVAIAATEIDRLIAFAADTGIDLTIIGPETPLVAGIVDRFTASGLRCFGPTQSAARLEGSKAFAKAFLKRHRIPTAAFASFTELAPALDHLHRVGTPIVVKADGLAAGKGVVLAEDFATAETALRDMLADGRFGDAGRRVVIEEFLQGEEASFIAMVDGEHPAARLVTGSQGQRRRRPRTQYRRHGRLLAGAGCHSRAAQAYHA